MVQDDKSMYTEVNSAYSNVAPAALTDLIEIPFAQDGKLEAFEFGAEEANWFYLIVRLAVDPFTVLVKKPFRLNDDGQVIYEESFEKPILTVGAGNSITVQLQTAGGAGVRYGLSLKTWQRRT